VEKILNISIVGLGETGVTIAALLISSESSFQLNIMDPSDWISGRLLDLRHAASFRNQKITLNDYAAFERADFVFFCAGVRNPKGTDRMATVRENKNMVQLVFQGVKFLNFPKIIVVTNPVELMTVWIQEYLKSDASVVGTGTMLDSERLRFILARELDCPCQDIKAEVLGEHGDSMTVFWNRSFFYGERLSEKLSHGQQLQLREELVKSAATIRKTEEATKFGVGQCALELMRMFLDTKGGQVNVSIKPTPEIKDLLDIESTVFVSLPVHISSNGAMSLSLEGYTETEINELKKSARKLDELYLQLS
jgi:L-lactate dehydrogenase